jgi:hypothetical protein
VSGRLNESVGGNEASELLFAAGEVRDKKRDFFRVNQLKANDPYYATSTRRSIYLPLVRNAFPDVLALFDAADPNGVTAVRNDTTTAAQALFLMNHPFIREAAAGFARRLLEKPHEHPAGSVRRAYRIALGREPDRAEIADALTFIEEYALLAERHGRSPPAARQTAWQSFCQTLLCSNEFLYVE